MRLEREAKRLLDAGVAGSVFPGAVACVAQGDPGSASIALAAAGRISPSAGAVTPRTWYDLASLTKPLVAMAALKLVQDGDLALGTRADSMVSEVRGGFAASATLEELLSHRSGLAAWGGLYLDVPHEPGSAAARRWIFQEASRRVGDEPRGACVYSDLGYMIAGEMVARASKERLDQAVASTVTGPLGLDGELVYAAAAPAEQRAELLRTAAPTERDEWRGRIVQGEVHDENAAALGGVAGHAGMFGKAEAVARFGLAVLASLNGDGLWKQSLVEKAVAERPGGTYRMGWDGRSMGQSSAGKRLSAASFGHLGFTGTSLWCDPERSAAIVLLSNRVHPSRANTKIKAFRPAFHDGIAALL